jgi:hypothetical protein
LAKRRTARSLNVRQRCGIMLGRGSDGLHIA